MCLLLYESNSICDLSVLWTHILHVSYHLWYQFHHKDPVNAYIIWQSLLLPSLSWLQCCPETVLSHILRMCSIPEKDKIDSKRMRVEAMTEKVEVSFAK